MICRSWSTPFSAPGRVNFNLGQQLVSGGFDICVAVFMRASFHREQAAAMQRFEIAKRKFVMLLAANFVATVGPQMPLAVFFNSAKLDELIFLRR